MRRKTTNPKIKGDEKRLKSGGPFSEDALTWGIGVEGHEWIEIDGEPVLTDHLTFGKQYRPYHPLATDGALAKRGLFLLFAQAEPTQDGFRKFADEYGMLGIRDQEVAFLHLRGEKLSTWIEEHRRISRAVHLWRCIEKGDVSDSIRRRNRAWQWHYPGEVRTYRDLIHSDTFPEIEDPVEAAKRFLQGTINTNMSRYLDVGGRILNRGVRLIVRPSDQGKFAIVVQPQSLIAAMWWQFARVFTGETSIGECKECHKPLQFGPDGFMSTREFCSPACKQKDHRRKVQEAKSLRESGLSPSAIAKRMNTSTASVKNWLTKKK